MKLNLKNLLDTVKLKFGINIINGGLLNGETNNNRR